MPEVFRTPTARTDLLEIWLYIAQDDLEAADQLLEDIDKTSRQLSLHPGLGRMRPELAPKLRSFPVGNYILFYRSSEAGLEIVRVLHGARDLPPLFE